MGNSCLAYVENSLTLKQALELYLVYLQRIKRSPATVNTYRKNLDKFFKYLYSYYNYQVYVDDVTDNDIERYLYEEYNSKDFSSAYRFNLITAFKCFYGFCYKSGYSNVDIGKQVRQVKRRVKERDYLTDIEVQRLFDSIEHPLINVVAMTMYYAGLRINECIGLTLDDVDFERNRITVKKDKEKHTRVIPMNYKLRTALIQYYNNRDGSMETENFFVTRRGSLSPNYTNLIIREASNKASINKEVTCHILRHSFASNLVLKGADIGQVQKLLGHTDLRSTDIYLHANMDELKKTVNLIS